MKTEATSGTSVLRIGRVNATYLVSRDHPSPSSVRSQLDAVAERMVAAACARLLGPLCGDGDPAVWFVRSLAVDVSVDTGWEADRLSEMWAAQVARSLGRRLAHGDDGAEVLRFPDRAAWLAQFLRDLADGVAWRKWYYASLDGLRELPLNAALREALCREPIAGEAALHQLADDGRIDTVLRTLSEADCRAVLDAFCRERPKGESTAAPTARLQTAWRAWQRTPPDTGVSVAPHRSALQLYLALRTDEVASSPALPQTLRALITLVRWMASPQAGPFFAALQRGDSIALLQLAGGDDPDSLAALLCCDRHSVIEIAEQLRQSTRSNTSETESAKAQTRFTPFGGAFYLLPRLAELGLEECAAALPALDETSPEALVRFLVLLKGLGAARAPRAFFDPVVRELAGVPPDLRPETVRAWARQVTPEIACDFQTRWAINCLKRGLVDGRWFCLRSARRGRLLLLADGARDIYLHTANHADELVRMVQAQSLATAQTEAFLCDPAMTRILPATIAGRPVRAWNSSEALAWSSADAALATCLERAPAPDKELNYFNLPSLLRGARPLDLALTLVARATLRNFAWRLPGFAWSSAEYLFTNFLNVSATIQTDPEHWLARLSKPMLHIVLAMTGATQVAYCLPWRADRPVQLTTSES